MVSVKDKDLYAIAGQEVANSVIDTGLWTKAFADSSGNDAQAKALYLKMRVIDLSSQRDNQQKKQILQQKQERMHQQRLVEQQQLVEQQVLNKLRPPWRRAARKVLNGFIAFGIWLWFGIMVFGGIMWLINST